MGRGWGAGCGPWGAAAVLLAPTALLVLALSLTPVAAGPRYSSRIVHTQHGAIRGVIVEVSGRRLEPVEAFLGVPYAGQPGRLRAAPAPGSWPGTRLADTPPPACPQPQPLHGANETIALRHMPRGLYQEMMFAAPMLSNQSEDCLYLNIFVPGSGARGVEAPYAVVVWTGGASAAWAAGAADGTLGAALAARGRLIVVTVNTRKGLLGYLTTGAVNDPVSAAGGAAVLDLVAALRWLQGHAAAFGGDPRRVTLLAGRAGAADAGCVLTLPAARGLLQRVMLLSGSPLAPAATADARRLREHVAAALRCHRHSDDPDQHWLEACISSLPLSVLTSVPPPRARFTAGWAPSPAVPPVGPSSGTAAASPIGPALGRALHASDAFLQCALVVVVCSTESYQYFNEDEIRHGFEEEHRLRILRTFVRNVFRFHRSEILAAIRNEYTEWERPIQHPVNIRDATLAATSDGAGVAPALQLARQHAARGAVTYLAHFTHQPRDPPYPQRVGSVGGDAEPFFLGIPLLGAVPGHNYSRSDGAVADTAVALLAAFAKTADPAGSGSGVAWPKYDLTTQQYLSIGMKSRVRSHYRAHRLALWLSLLPQLHRPAHAPRAHHRLPDDDSAVDMYAGELLPELDILDADGELEEGSGEEMEDSGVAGDVECTPPTTAASPPSPPPAAAVEPDPNATLEPLPYNSYGAALGVTVGAGCALLALNLLVLGALYTQRRRPQPARRARRHACDASLSASQPPASPGPSPVLQPEPRKSTLKSACGPQRSSECERAGAAAGSAAGTGHKKRVHIQEISV